MDSGINKNAVAKVEVALNEYIKILKNITFTGIFQTNHSAVVGDGADSALLKYTAQIKRDINNYIDELYKPLTSVINTARSNYAASDKTSASLNNSRAKLKS